MSLYVHRPSIGARRKFIREGYNEIKNQKVHKKKFIVRKLQNTWELCAIYLLLNTKWNLSNCSQANVVQLTVGRTSDIDKKIRLKIWSRQPIVRWRIFMLIVIPLEPSNLVNHIVMKACVSALQTYCIFSLSWIYESILK